MIKNFLEKFRKVIKEFKKGKYIFLVGNMLMGIKNLEVKFIVLWMYVFDFD